jgi:cardiolipin synthase
MVARPELMSPSAQPQPAPVVDAPAPPKAKAPRARILRYMRSRMRWRAHNTMTLLRAGAETYPAMLRAIAGAQRTIHLETYILRDDGTGRRFADALVERALAGVQVRLMYDSVGAMEITTAYLDGLRAAGIEVVAYRPLKPWRRRWGIFRRNHRKVLVVDDEVAFTGGLNIADDYADVSDGGHGWHDMHCELRGPIVLDLAWSFRRVWIREHGRPYPPPPRAEDEATHDHGPHGPPVLVRLLENTERRGRSIIRRAYLAAINAARESIYLENAYFLPDRGVRAALVRAARRGVDVAVIVPGRSDIKAIEYAGLWSYPRLVKRGVRILRWTGEMMHAKTAVVDGLWSTVGSYNLDWISLRYNLEIAVEMVDPEVGQVMVQQFRRDVALTEPVPADLWSRLPWWKKVLAMLAFRIRRWL